MFLEFDPDLVVLDMNMPKMNGASACAAIRQTSNVPVIMFTSTNDAMEVRTAILNGASDFVLKSTGVTELTDRISFHLDKQKNPDPLNPAPSRNKSTAVPVPKISTTTLIVDPDEQVRTTIKAILTRLNQNVVEAANGTDAVEAFKQHNPDIVISEKVLPDIDAIKMLPGLKRPRGNNELLKLLMSKRLSPEAERKAHFAGITNILDKPLNGAKLEIMIAENVRKAMRALKRNAATAA
jgi:DNA-binding response OmpR family regulator